MSRVVLNAANRAQSSPMHSLIRRSDEIDPGHGARVGAMAACLAAAGGYGIDPPILRDAGLLHDVGKLVLPPAIRDLRFRLTSSERKLIEQHPAFGVGLIRASGETVHPRVLEAVLLHHEWYDGSGYPLGVRGPLIPLSARLVGIADVIDALLSARAYKRAWSAAEVQAHLRGLSGRQFEPALARLADRMFGMILDAREKTR